MVMFLEKKIKEDRILGQDFGFSVLLKSSPVDWSGQFVNSSTNHDDMLYVCVVKTCLYVIICLL